MPILRLSAQEIRGFVIDDDPQRAMQIVTTGRETFAALVRQAMTDHNLRPVVCEPGLINVTPAYWKRNRSDYLLEVLPGGESALHHVVPKSREFEPVVFTSVEGVVRPHSQLTARTIRIPEDTAAVPIVGPIAEDSRLRIHEIIMHRPPSE